jgi:6-phosphogluconolactonase (cycloisomerase 2 family)
MRSAWKGAASALLTALVVFVVPAGVAHASPDETSGAVFAQTNDPAGNSVLVYTRHADGTLTTAGSYATGGNGAAQPGAVVDPLASQGATVYDRNHNLLFTVNAGSDSISTFTADGDRLTLQQVISSGGPFPTSLGVRGNLLYALNAGDDGTVVGFRIAASKLVAIPHSTRSLGLANTNPPFFLDSPGQVGFTPDGRDVIVTTKRNGKIDVFPVGPDGRLGPRVENASPDPVPFAFDFDSQDRLAVVSAGSSALTIYEIRPNGTLDLIAGPVGDTQKAGCWVLRVPGDFFYIANTGSASLSTFHVDGGVTLTTPASATGAGPIDLASSSDGQFVYAETGGGGTIEEFRVETNGALTPIGTISGLAAGLIEGIAAT